MVGAGTVTVDAEIAEAPVAFVAGIAGPVTGVGKRMTEIAESAFFKSWWRNFVQRTICTRPG